MSDKGQPIDPSKMIGGRRAMTQSHQKETKRQNAHIPKRGRGRRGDGSGTYQVVHPSHCASYFADDIMREVAS